jgi:CelD/BcsL family acetyltransferase involved in cellulose biosynthesis
LNQGLQTLYSLRPLNDPRWGRFVQRNAQSSIFHTAQWLDALHQTYRYEPIAITTCAPGAELDNALVFCQIESWLTGRRLVSLPFSDHCDPLSDDGGGVSGLLLASLQAELTSKGLRYVEIRPTRSLDAPVGQYPTYHTYCLHQIDLTADLDTLFHNCHKSSVQRKIARADREGLTQEEGRSERLLDSFYRLLLLTRRRHRVPPQPKRWFKNLIDSLGDALAIRVVRKDSQAIASILTLRFKDTLVYKYGCSDERFHQLGGMHLLFWKSICDAKRDGLRVFDLGRSDCEDRGLITFKDRWGAKRSPLVYLRWSASAPSRTDSMTSGGYSKDGAVATFFRYVPDSLLRAVGTIFYKHAG